LIDPTLLKEGGLLALSVLLSFWSWTLWMRVKELETIITTLNATCLACSRTHAERLLELGNGAVAALEKSTEAIAASHRQEEIIKRLGDMASSERRRKADSDR
jgi:hypothetical protein